MRKWKQRPLKLIFLIKIFSKIIVGLYFIKSSKFYFYNNITGYKKINVNKLKDIC